jgi:hypothetical protein
MSAYLSHRASGVNTRTGAVGVIGGKGVGTPGARSFKVLFCCFSYFATVLAVMFLHDTDHGQLGGRTHHTNLFLVLGGKG